MAGNAGNEGSNTGSEGGQKKSETVSNGEHQKILDQLVQMKSTNSRLLTESKDNADKFRVLRDNVDAKEKKKLEVDGKTDELLAIEKNNVFKLQEQMKERSKRELQKDLEIEVARYAGDSHDLKDVVAALPLEMLTVDEESGEVSNVKEAVAKVREDKSYMFKSKETPTTVSTRPQHVADKGPSQKDKFASAIDFLVTQHKGAEAS